MLFFAHNFRRRGDGGGKIGSFCFPPRISVFSCSLSHSASTAVVPRSTAFFLAVGLGDSEASLGTPDEVSVEDAAATAGAFDYVAPLFFCFFFSASGFSASGTLDSNTLRTAWRVRYLVGPCPRPPSRCLRPIRPRQSRQRMSPTPSETMKIKILPGRPTS